MSQANQATSVPHQRLHLQIRELSKDSARAVELSEELKALNRVIESHKTIIRGLLEEVKQDQWNCPGTGKVRMKWKESFLVPKTKKKRDEFWDYLKELGVFEDLISVNSQTLGKFCRDRKKDLFDSYMATWDPNAEHTPEEIAKHEEKLLELSTWEVPGIGKPGGYFEVKFDRN